jgi:hypothetical protein
LPPFATKYTFWKRSPTRVSVSQTLVESGLQFVDLLLSVLCLLRVGPVVAPNSKLAANNAITSILLIEQLLMNVGHLRPEWGPTGTTLVRVSQPGVDHDQCQALPKLP